MSQDTKTRNHAATHRDGFVTRISHDIYQKLARKAERELAPAGHGGRVSDTHHRIGRWKWLHDAMQQSIEQARVEASEHREIAHEHFFVLDRIEFAPEGEEVRQSLEHFMREFNGEARVSWIKHIWQGHGQDGFSLDALQDVCLRPREGPDQARSPEEDAHDRALRAESTPDTGGGLVIRFVGAWKNARGRPLRPAPLPGAQATVQATLLIHDAQGQRAIEMRDQDLTLGNAGDIPVHGKYVSRRHLRLFTQDARLWAEDAGSTNGVWLGDVRLRVHERREIHDNAEFRLGAAQHALNLNEQDCPRVMVTRIVARAPAPGVTPVLGNAPTPVLGGPQPAPDPRLPLLRLTLAAAAWRRDVPVHHLPFALGRSHTCDFRLPKESKAVSGCHLRLLELGLPDGVWVEDLDSTRGSYLGGERRTGRFLLPLGQPLTLGGSGLNDRHQPVELTARRAEGEET